MMSQLIADLHWRYATKNFDPNKKVSTKNVNELCEALRLSASSFGLQFWKFLLITNQKLKEKLRPHSSNQSQITDCSHLFVLCSPLSIGDDAVDRFIHSHCQIRSLDKDALLGYAKMIKSFIARMDEQQRRHWMDKQIYLALGNLLTCCAVKRMDACPLEGFSSRDYNQVLKLTENNLRSVVVCAVGFRSPSDKDGGLPKVRYPLNEVLLKYD